jgi:hypothetical protein
MFLVYEITLSFSLSLSSNCDLFSFIISSLSRTHVSKQANKPNSNRSQNGKLNKITICLIITSTCLAG